MDLAYRIFLRACLAFFLASLIWVFAAPLIVRPAKADIVSSMEADEGRNPTGWARRWCAKYLNMTLARVGLPVWKSNLASSFRGYGRPAPAGARGAIAVMRSHVGVSTGARCKIGYEIISGNHGGTPGRRTVGKGCYRANAIVAWRWPGYNVALWSTD